MTKYEFCWTVSPPPHHRLEAKKNVDAFEVELAGGQVIVRSDYTDTPEEELKERAETIAVALAHATGYRLGQQLTPVFSRVMRTPSTAGPTDIGLFLVDQMPEMRDHVRCTVEKHHKVDAVIVIDSDDVEAGEIFTLAEKARRDPALQQMLDFIGKFRTDSEKKLAPLYDILQTVERQFCGRDNAASALGLQAADLNELGRIANDPTIRTSRHSGKSTGAQRAITNKELADCMQVAEAIIRAYAAQV